MVDNYTPLHVHSDHSRLDAISQIPDLAEKAKKLGIKSLALTDHGTISGWLKLYKECKDRGIKSIFGLEAYICDDATLISRTDIELEDLNEKKGGYMPLFDGIESNPHEKIEELKALKTTVRKSNHIILLAKNMVGYRNIMKLSSMAYVDGYYYKPRIDLKMLEKYSEGLIVNSACLGGQITSNILKDDIAKAEFYLLEYKRIFKDDFYLEMQLHPVDEQIKANKGLMALAKKHNVKTIISQDSHYTEAEDVFLHEVVIKLKNGLKEDKLKKVDADTPREVDIIKSANKLPKRMAHAYKGVMTDKLSDKKDEVDSDGYFYNAREYYFKSFDELKESWRKHHQYMTEEEFNDSMDNTNKIADKIEKISAYSTDVLLPKFDCGELSPRELFTKIVKQGAIKRIKPKIKGNEELKRKYDARLTEELNVILDLKFEGYFLIVWDLIHWCRSNDIMTGPGRGSVGASLIAYAIGVTNVDPIEHDLTFTRFINKTRSMAKYKLEFDEFKLEKK